MPNAIFICHQPMQLAAGVSDGDVVSVRAENERGAIFNHVQIRVDDSFTLEMHIDTDEANGSMPDYRRCCQNYKVICLKKCWGQRIFFCPRYL